jgi:hypothetical protein
MSGDSRAPCFISEPFVLSLSKHGPSYRTAHKKKESPSTSSGRTVMDDADFTLDDLLKRITLVYFLR